MLPGLLYLLPAGLLSRRGRPMQLVAKCSPNSALAFYHLLSSRFQGGQAFTLSHVHSGGYESFPVDDGGVRVAEVVCEQVDVTRFGKVPEAGNVVWLALRGSSSGRSVCALVVMSGLLDSAILVGRFYRDSMGGVSVEGPCRWFAFPHICGQLDGQSDLPLLTDFRTSGRGSSVAASSQLVTAGLAFCRSLDISAASSTQ